MGYGNCFMVYCGYDLYFIVSYPLVGLLRIIRVFHILFVKDERSDIHLFSISKSGDGVKGEHYTPLILQHKVLNLSSQ